MYGLIRPNIYLIHDCNLYKTWWQCQGLVRNLTLICFVIIILYILRVKQFPSRLSASVANFSKDLSDTHPIVPAQGFSLWSRICLAWQVNKKTFFFILFAIFGNFLLFNSYSCLIYLIKILHKGDTESPDQYGW